MTKPKPFFLLILPLFMLACSLTAQVTPSPLNERSAILPALKQIMPTQTTTNPPKICQVKTGFSQGRLNVRSCSGLACPVLAVIVEGETLTPIQTVPMKGWLEIQTGSLRGWVNSKLIHCEVKK